jgi:monoamine oxidase
MTNDFIIIGGGIAGLYTMYNILKKRPNSKIILIEKENNLGGRIHTFTDKYISVEAGAGRFHENNILLLELIRELGLYSKIKTIASSASYAQVDCCGNFFNSILDAPKREPSSVFNLNLDMDDGGDDSGIISLPGSQYVPFFLPFSFNLFEPIFKNILDIALGTENIPNAELILRVILASKGEPVKRLQNMSFISYAKNVLSKIEIDFIKSSFGYYSELVIMNAYDAIYLMEKHLSPIHPFYSLKGGLSQIIENLEKRILKFKNSRIIKGFSVSSIVFSKKDNEFIINCRSSSGGGGVSGASYTSKKCICALPKNALEKLTIFNPLHSLIDKVQCSPLCRIYSKFPLNKNNEEKREPWFKGLTKLTTNNNLRMIIPMNEEQGIIMSSYTDNKYARFWKELFDKEGEPGLNKELVRLLQQSTGLEVDDPIKTYIFYWPCGVGYWSIGANSENVSKQMIIPFPDLDLFICGENYSHHNQQWIEGALETSNFVLENLSL